MYYYPTTLAPKQLLQPKLKKLNSQTKTLQQHTLILQMKLQLQKQLRLQIKISQIPNVKVEVVGGPYTYTGKEIVPTIKVTVDGVELAKDIDYKIKSCTNNKNACEATVTVEGDGDYTGTQTVKFTINKANLDDVKVEANTKDHKAAFTYNGKQD